MQCHSCNWSKGNYYNMENEIYVEVIQDLVKQNLVLLHHFPTSTLHTLHIHLYEELM
jgi:hypothetical protein